MEALLASLEAAWWAQLLRTSRWGYAAISAVHVLGLALLVGAVLPLDLRLLGFRRFARHEELMRVLAPVAAAGLAIAIVSGVALLAVRATEYVTLGVMQAKLALVAAGTLSAIIAHCRHGPALAEASPGQLAFHGSVSLACWLGALVCGRLIAFAGV